MKYRIKIGDNREEVFGYSKRDAWQNLIDRVPHYIYCTKPDDLIPDKDTIDLEKRIQEMPIDPWLRYTE